MLRTLLDEAVRNQGKITGVTTGFKLLDNITDLTGIERLIWGGSSQISLPSGSRVILSGFFPKETCVSIGSRKGSIGGFVT